MTEVHLQDHLETQEVIVEAQDQEAMILHQEVGIEILLQLQEETETLLQLQEETEVMVLTTLQEEETETLVEMITETKEEEAILT